MNKNNKDILIDKNLDHLTEFLIQEMEQSSLAAQISDGAHIFYGAYDDKRLTEDNLQLASKVLLGMILGYVQDAPLVMVFKHKSGKRTATNLFSETWKNEARTFVAGFSEQAQREMAEKFHHFVPA